MVKVNLKGVFKVRSKGRTYYYAWRGGPRLSGKPGSPEFVASYREAHETRKAPDPTRVRGLVASYKASKSYRDLADSTRRQWAPWLDRIEAYFGELAVAQFDRPEKIRLSILRWRDRWSDRPRAADYGMQVLSRLMSYAVEQGRLTSNPCEGFKSLYRSNRAEIIWTDDDLAALKNAASPEVYAAAQLAAHTALRLGDLLRLSWSHVGDHAIAIRTGKSGQTRTAYIPLYDDLRRVLETIPRRSTAILTNSKGAPWTKDGFSSSFNKAKKRAGLDERDLHFHDLRGTAATRFYTAGLDRRVIAEICGWSEAQVEKILHRYVDRNAATLAAIKQLNESERRTEIAKPFAKP